MKQFTLPKTGGLARIDALSEADLADVLALQEAARAALPDSMKMFVLPQSDAYYQSLLAQRTGLMIGIRNTSDGALIAQMGLMGPMELREAIALNRITSNDVPFHHAALDDSVIICKSMAAHPAWRGNELAQNLISFTLDLPFALTADHLFCQISVGNKRSWDVFAKAGFGIVAAAFDPRDQQPRFVFQKPVFGFDLARELSADDVDPIDDFPAIISLTQREALIGAYQPHSETLLAFQRNRELNNLLPSVAALQQHS